MEKTWRLNERHYGGLTGLNKAETAAKHGEEQVNILRREEILNMRLFVIPRSRSGDEALTSPLHPWRLITSSMTSSGQTEGIPARRSIILFSISGMILATRTVPLMPSSRPASL